jgi:hypothetical protein
LKEVLPGNKRKTRIEKTTTTKQGLFCSRYEQIRKVVGADALNG